MSKPIIFSGIQPTGRKHLGNYIGAIRQYVEGQDRGDPAIYCIVDLHATSVAYEPSALPRYVYDTTAMLMAAGLEPPRHVAVHGWLLVGGEKMSKTRVNQIAPGDLVSDLGVDAVRHHLLRDVPFGPDGDFSLNWCMRVRSP